MRIKLAKGNKKRRLDELNRHNWKKMEIIKIYLYLEDGDNYTCFRLIGVHEGSEIDFNYDFVKRLIENAD